MAWSEKCKIAQNVKNGVYITETRTGGHIKVRSVDFGAKSPKIFTAMLAAGLDGGILEVYADSLKGIKLATINLTRTGGWDTWKQFVSTVETPLTGVHDLYFVFKGQNITAGRELYNFDYWQFER